MSGSLHPDDPDSKKKAGPVGFELTLTLFAHARRNTESNGEADASIHVAPTVSWERCLTN